MTSEASPTQRSARHRRVIMTTCQAHLFLIGGGTEVKYQQSESTAREPTRARGRGRTVLYVYPLTGRPDTELPDGGMPSQGTLEARRLATAGCGLYRTVKVALQKLGRRHRSSMRRAPSWVASNSRATSSGSRRLGCSWPMPAAWIIIASSSSTGPGDQVAAPGSSCSGGGGIASSAGCDVDARR